MAKFVNTCEEFDSSFNNTENNLQEGRNRLTAKNNNNKAKQTHKHKTIMHIQVGEKIDAYINIYKSNNDHQRLYKSSVSVNKNAAVQRDKY